MEFGESISSQTICQHTQRSAQAQHLACTSHTSFVSSQESLLVLSPSSLWLWQRFPQGRAWPWVVLAAESCWAETVPAGRVLLVGLQARGSCAQWRGKRREPDFTPRRSCEPSEHRQSWVEKPWRWRLVTKLKEHKTEQTLPWPTLDEWPAEKDELLKNHVSSYRCKNHKI